MIFEDDDVRIQLFHVSKRKSFHVIASILKSNENHAQGGRPGRVLSGARLRKKKKE